MQEVNLEAEVGLFLQELISEVQQEYHKFQSTFLNKGCNFYIGKGVPHPGLISTAFFNETLPNSEFSIYISTETSTFSLAGLNISQVMRQFHPATNRFGDYRFSLDPSGKFIYVYNIPAKIGAVWISPSVSEAPEMLITPFRTLVAWILEEDGGVILHAASFTVEGVNTLLAGPSGSGKSTIAFEALSHSETVICDDAIALTINGFFPIYRKMKMKSFVDFIEVSGSKFKCEKVGNKSVLDLNQVTTFPSNGYLPDFLLFPSLNFESEFVEISMLEALKRLITDSFTETLGSSVGALRLIKTSLSKTKMYEWKLDPNPILNWEELELQVLRT